MKKYWTASNKDFAEMSTLHRVLGCLDFYEDEGKQIDPAALRKYICSTVENIRNQLDNDFPDHASE